MGEQTDTSATEADLIVARSSVKRGVHGVVVAMLGIVGVSGFVVGAISVDLGDVGVIGSALATCGLMLLVGAPLVLVLSRLAQRRGLEIALESAVQERIMASDARRREFETRLARALEMATDEVDAYDTIRRAFDSAVPDVPVELLLADNSHAHLSRVVMVRDERPFSCGCSVTSPDQCVAARRAQTQVFPDSDALDACPLLRGRGDEPFSAVCVPVSIMGRTVGVVHATESAERPLDDDAIRALQVLANHAGNRLGMIRIMAETQLQASTDGLTGLMNRRSLENRARIARTSGEDFALVMADLDHFKGLNDAHGHETGDRALRIFAETLRATIRVDDYACRFGGEEFVVLLPRADISEAIEVMERVRGKLAEATGRGDVPVFTASFGIAHSDDADDFDDLLLRADHALFKAKDSGRDCICIDGYDIAVAPNLTAIN
jgi:diguanylate cyclase (GGDEF)-like protein